MAAVYLDRWTHLQEEERETKIDISTVWFEPVVQSPGSLLSMGCSSAEVRETLNGSRGKEL